MQRVQCVCMFNAEAEKQQGGKTQGAYEGGQAGEMEKL